MLATPPPIPVFILIVKFCYSDVLPEIPVLYTGTGIYFVVASWWCFRTVL
jgi:hypothetical protein